MKQIDFIFDFISPYAYLAFKQLDTLEASLGIQVKMVPVLFAGLLNAHGNLGPAEVPAKRSHVIRDALRKAQRLRLSLAVPPAHPFNPLLALRLVLAAETVGLQREVIASLFDAVWGQGAAIDRAESCSALLADLQGDLLLEAAGSDSVKLKLRSNTDQAVANGVFGVPTFVVDGELFWGVDSVPLLIQFLTVGDQFDQDLVQRWDSLPAAANRSRPTNK
ncbi:MAG: isomerase [Lysobacteraceae bacterium]|nr:MAG: isomerase [Xanthomonadaceae bacterium]